MEQIDFEEFLRLDVRVGTIVRVENFLKARKPAYILMIDFGEAIGIKKSSAQITENYSPDQLVGRQVLAVVNFSPRQIGPIKSQVLTLGFEDEKQQIVLAGVEKNVPNGQRMM
ncbi:Protein secretion chaperonin CsaA [hydrothermal vent metagenome]|uniref:Protein secretion chaperonin CsaA n=1 Tax=hydrothermal vent metagenome TaxID=652676 RepID=A0A3B0U836_9ZZZZ